MTDLWLVGLLVLLSVTFALWGLFCIRRARRNRLRELIERPRREGGVLDSPGAVRVLVPAPGGPGSAGIAGWLRSLVPAAWLERVHWRLLWAGRPGGWSAEEFIAARIGLALVLASLLPLIFLRLGVRGQAPVQVAVAVLLAAIGFNLPEFWLNSRVEARRGQTQRELPLFLDLTATAVEAGLPLGEAIRRVAEELEGLVASEFMRVYQEMAAGKPRAAAWRDLADRTPSQELRAVALSIIQAEQYGTSVSGQLRLQVRQLREGRQRQAQELAQAASVKMRIPMLLFIMIPFLALVLGPAILGLAELLS